MSPRVIELNDVDVPAFLNVLDSCDGNVYMMTRDGDRLNLRSKLSQLVGLTALIEGGKIVKAFVMCERESDEEKLIRFNRLEETALRDDDA